MTTDPSSDTGGTTTHRGDFEDLLTELSATFVNVQPEQLDRRINDALQRIVLFLGIDRSTLAQFDPTAQILKVTHSWAVAGIQPLPATLDGSQMPVLTKLLREGKQLAFSRLEDMPEEAVTDMQFARSLDLKSVVLVPLKSTEEFLGILAFGAIRTARTWPDRFVQRLKLIGEIFTNALLQCRREIELNIALKELSDLKERLEAENVLWREEALRSEESEEMVGNSPAFRHLRMQIAQVAKTDSTVLIQGETGTGKELVATAIHRRSQRSDKPLIRVNCAALPAELMESELFGHERGAFTGALTRKIGRFELAHGGTIVLDEIGEIPLSLQAKLLRVLQSGEFERLGSASTRSTDSRVIASTNRDLRAMTEEGSFRSDLFYRLQVFPIDVPPLRKRPQDIPLLAAYFLDKLGSKLGKRINRIPDAVIQSLTANAWPGNVRELENIIERSMIVSSGPTLTLSGVSGPDLAASETPDVSPGDDLAGVRALEDVERDYIRTVCVLCDWKIHGKGNAADRLRINPNTLRSRMKKLGIRRPV